jgi:hypothetical protein
MCRSAFENESGRQHGFRVRLFCWFVAVFVVDFTLFHRIGSDYTAMFWAAQMDFDDNEVIDVLVNAGAKGQALNPD